MHCTTQNGVDKDRLDETRHEYAPHNKPDDATCKGQRGARRRGLEPNAAQPSWTIDLRTIDLRTIV